MIFVSCHQYNTSVDLLKDTVTETNICLLIIKQVYKIDNLF